MQIPRTLRRLFPGITLLLIVAIAYLQARGLVQLLALALGGSCDRSSSLPPPRETRPPVATAPEVGQAITERKLLDSLSAPLRDAAPRDGWAQGASPVASLPAPSFVVPRAPVSAFVGSAPPLVGTHPLQLRSLRIVPEQRAGKVVGLRLFGVHQSSLLGTLGLKNGDRLDSINGFELGNPEKALEAYARLRNASRLHLRLDRAGQAVEIDLNII